jgi:hypothetical protein
MIEERVIASWKFKKGVLDAKTASLCYLAANLAAGNNAAKTHTDILKVWQD